MRGPAQWQNATDTYAYDGEGNRGWQQVGLTYDVTDVLGTPIASLNLAGGILVYQWRVREGVPPSKGTNDEPFTRAWLAVGGHTFYGTNAHGRPIDLVVNNSSRTHAESDVFQQAKDAGISGGAGVLYVDRPLCQYCGLKGAVKSFARQIGLTSLTVYVYTPDGILQYGPFNPFTPPNVNPFR